MYGTIKIEVDSDSRIKIMLFAYKTKDMQTFHMFELKNKHGVLWCLENYTTTYHAEKVMDSIYN
jgi:hypothetical protein